jgi:hypothetical protein
MSVSYRLAAAGMVLVAAAYTHAALPRVIFSNIAASPTSDVPGLPGKKFNPGTSSQFDRPFVSPDGTRWIIGALADDPVNDLDVVIVGSGPTSAGSNTVFKEGDAAPDGNGTITLIRTQMGINNAGQFVFNGDTSAATTVDDVVIRWNGSAFDVVAREGTAAPGQPAGVGYGSSNNASHILANGNVRFRSAALTGNTTQQVLYENSSIASGVVVAQTDITAPGGQLFAPVQTLDNLTSDRFISDATGANYLYHGDLNGPTATDLVMVFNGNVVAQEGAVLPGSGFATPVAILSGDAGSQQISRNNGWYMFRGNNADGTGATATDWVVRNGVVVAQTDAPITPGSTELYDDSIFTTTFFINTIDDNGNFVIGGVTNNSDVNKNAVLVYNGSEVLLRENDPVDLDGNGLADDDAFISIFNNDDSFLTNDGYYYFMADLRNGAGATIGQAFLSVQVPEPGSLAALGLLAAGLLRRRS